MATYDELFDISTGTSGAPLQKKIKVAVIVCCEKIRLELDTTANHASRMKWAAATLRDPDTAARQMMLAVLAQNRAFTATQISSADDATVQTAVDAAVNLLAQG